MKIGIIGLPNVGKSTLFNALTGAGVPAENRPFCTIKPNIGTVPVPDGRLEVLAGIFQSEKVVHASVDFVDIAGLVKGASKGEGLGNKFLANIREVDAIVHVIRCFSDDDVIHVDGVIDPARDAETVETELILADIETLEKRLEKNQKAARATGDAKLKHEVDLEERLLNHLSSGKPARNFTDDSEDIAIMKDLFLLTDKPVIYACNVSESDLSDINGNVHVNNMKDLASRQNAGVIVVSAKIEEEISKLDKNEKKDFLNAVGLNESGLDRLVGSSYALLGLISFLTGNKTEVHAWTIKNGTKAPQAAGKIHNDFEKGFIKAEVAVFGELVEYGSLNALRENGKLRIEGKDYVVREGDVILFRFNV
jgi:ribosome-binding ATPase